MKKLFPALLLAACTAVPAIRPVLGAELVVGAPPELAGCLDALSAAFLAGEKGARLRFVTDASEELYVKVSEGRPIDVYMSPDMRLQGQLLADGKMVYDTWTMYATGRIVLWTADRRFDVTKGIRLLFDPAVKNVAAVNAANPYIGITYAALHHAGLLDKTMPRLVESDDMQGLVKSVRAGKAQVALLSYETVLAPPMQGVGRYYMIPESEYEGEVLGHAAVVTLHGKANPLAHRFVHFLKTARAQAILVPRGFMRPPPGSVEVR